MRITQFRGMVCDFSLGFRSDSYLAKSPSDISLLDVVEAIDGPILLNECVAENSNCNFGSDCPMKPVWCDAQEELVTRLGRTNFANMSNGH